MMNSLFSAKNSVIQDATKTGFWSAVFALIAFFWYLQPELFALQVSPMNGDLWAIKDPTVSWSAFMPGFREFRYELFEHGNILWSNMRGMGQPTLGNSVQGAPLFPLSLALIWLPDQLFWSVMPMARIILISLMLFLLARNVFKLHWAAALIFALLAGYNLHVFRWINHPWSNGTLAGVWYLYFLCRVTFPGHLSTARQRWHAVGLVVGIIGMITNGFPEASALFAVITLFVFSAVAAANFSQLRAHFWSLIMRLGLLHVIGFGVSIIQIVALIEYIDYTHLMGLREGYISGTWKPEQVYPFLVSQLSVFWKTDLQRTYMSFTIGAVGAYLALQGLLNMLLDAKRFGRIAIAVGIGFLLCMTLFVVKSFGLSSSVEWVFSKTPVLDVSHFPLYFPPMFFFGTAYFAALGILAYRYPASESRSYHWAKLLWSLATLALLVIAIREVAIHFSDMGMHTFWASQLSGDGFHFIWLLLAIAVMVMTFHGAHALRLRRIKNRALGHTMSFMIAVLAVIGVGLEQRHTVKANYAGIDAPLLFRNQDEWRLIEQAVEKSGLPKHELRARDESGSYIQNGLATIDNGVSAMLPTDLLMVRRTLYHTAYGGYLPLRAPLYDWSGWLLSNNLVMVNATPFTQMDWSGYQATDTLAPKHANDKTTLTMKRKNPVFIADWVSSFTLPNATTIWARLDDGKQARWLRTNNGGRRSATTEQKTQTSSLWRIRLPLHAVPSNEYQLTLRVVDEQHKQYQDTAPITLILEQPLAPYYEGLVPHSPSESLLAESADRAYSIYLEHNALPRAFVASGCVIHEEVKDSLALLAEGLPVLAGKVSINSQTDDFCADYRREFKRTSILEDRGSTLLFDEIKGPALLYVNDSYYPGWQATDVESGEQFEIKRANVAMRAVYLPEAKNYKIEMTYKPAWLRWVQIITLLALGLLAWVLLNIRRSN